MSHRQPRTIPDAGSVLMPTGEGVEGGISATGRSPRDRAARVLAKYAGRARVRARAALIDLIGDSDLERSELLTLGHDSKHYLDHLVMQVADVQAQNAQLRAELSAASATLIAIGQVASDDEAATRRLLQLVRTSESYGGAYENAEPLVSVCIPTYNNLRGLLEVAIPSALAQTYPNVEVVVVGDCEPDETGDAIASLGDRRVRYENLSIRGPYPEQERALWFVAGTAPLNHAMKIAQGEWIAILNDDDSFRVDHVSTLLGAARERHVEVVYGRIEQHSPDGTRRVLGSFPPADHAFGWQMSLQHAALRLFEFELSAWLFDEPGDWHRARRMLRAGVSFHMVDEIVTDYFPSRLWRPQ